MKAVTDMATRQLSEQTSSSPSAATGAKPTTGGYDEQIAEIANRLERRYPDERISRSDLEDRVRHFYRQFDTAHIRTFVAVFVERLVRRSIEQPPGSTL